MVLHFFLTNLGVPMSQIEKASLRIPGPRQRRLRKKRVAGALLLLIAAASLAVAATISLRSDRTKQCDIVTLPHAAGLTIVSPTTVSPNTAAQGDDEPRVTLGAPLPMEDQDEPKQEPQSKPAPLTVQPAVVPRGDFESNPRRILK